MIPMPIKRFLLLMVCAGPLLAASAPKPFVLLQPKDATYRGFEDDVGGFYLVWTDSGTENHAKLFIQHIGADGKSQWDNEPGILVSDQLVSSKEWNGLATGKGDLILSWNEASGAFFQRIRPDGSIKREGMIHLSSSTAYQPDATNDATGGTLVVWGEMQAGGQSVLKAQRLSAQGKPAWPMGGIRVSSRSSYQTNPRVIYDNMSGMIIGWRDLVNEASELRLQRIDFQGNRLWGAQGLKVYAPVGAAEFPIMAPVGQGEVVVVWTAADRQVNQIYLQKAGPKAVLNWESKTLASTVPIPYNRWNPTVVGDEAGGTWIGWEDVRDQQQYQIYLNLLHSDGASAWPTGEIFAGPALGDQGKLSMATDGNQGVWLAWIDNRLATVGLYVQKVNPSGKRLLDPRGKLVQNQLVKPTKPQILSVAPGKAVVIWADEPKKGAKGLYWSLL